MATTSLSRWARAPLLLAAVAACLVAPAAPAQRLAGAELVGALQEGGYVLVIRNARASEEPPEEGEEAPANLKGEREITEYGQGQMSALSYAFRELEIPVGQTSTSPAYRSEQSANYFGFGERVSVDALAEAAEGGDPSWLGQRVAEVPPPSQNTVIVTHGSLIAEALGREVRDIRTAETLIYRPRDGDADLVARLTVEDWAEIAVD